MKLTILISGIISSLIFGFIFAGLFGAFCFALLLTLTIYLYKKKVEYDGDESIINIKNSYTGIPDNIKNDIDDICEEYQDEVKQMVKRNGSLNLDEAKEILSDLKNNLEEFLEESSHDEMSDEDYFDLEEYAGDCVSNFISFLNEHTD